MGGLERVRGTRNEREDRSHGLPVWSGKIFLCAMYAESLRGLPRNRVIFQRVLFLETVNKWDVY